MQTPQERPLCRTGSPPPRLKVPSPSPGKRPPATRSLIVIVTVALVAIVTTEARPLIVVTFRPPDYANGDVDRESRGRRCRPTAIVSHFGIDQLSRARKR